MLDVVSLLSTGLAFFVVAAAPGPATLSTAVTAMHHGRKSGLVYGAGLTCGLAVWGVLAVSGMGAVLQSSVYVLGLLKIAGGLYLLWLAISSFRDGRRGSIETRNIAADRRLFSRGFLLNLSNPKALVAWMTALSIGLDADDNLTAVSIAATLCIVIGYFVYVLYLMLFSLHGVMKAYRRFHRHIHNTMAVVFSAAAFGLIRSAFTR
ncbi:MAG: LysE family translocator [Pseudomonadota bacterium]